MSYELNPITGELDKVGGGSVTETDPVFSASEAALFAAGDKAKLDSALQTANIDGGSSISTYLATQVLDCEGA